VSAGKKKAARNRAGGIPYGAIFMDAGGLLVMLARCQHCWHY